MSNEQRGVLSYEQIFYAQTIAARIAVAATAFDGSVAASEVAYELEPIAADHGMMCAVVVHLARLNAELALRIANDADQAAELVRAEMAALEPVEVRRPAEPEYAAAEPEPIPVEEPSPTEPWPDDPAWPAP